MTRADACKRLTQLLALDAVGDLVSAIGDADVADLLLKAMARCRGLASDADDAARLAPPTVKP